MQIIVPLIASFTAGYITMTVIKWSFTYFGSFFKYISSASKMKMALIVRTDLGMDRGKSASKCVQAAISCYKKSLREAPSELKIWEMQGQPKVVLKPDQSGEDVLLQYRQKAESLGLISSVIKNESNLICAIGIGPGNVDEINKVVGHLKLL